MSVRAIDLDPAIRLALSIIVRHVEPGWENCTAVVKAWLNGNVQQLATVTAAVMDEAPDDIAERLVKP